MITVRHPPPPPPMRPPLNSLPTSPGGSTLRTAPEYDPRTMTSQPLPRQYAYPLSRHNSYYSQDSGSENGRDRRPPEHMLRRKTPNGILAAAYDGTSVEETEKPHATKHILLPVTAESGLLYGMKQELPLRSPAANNNYSHVQHLQQTQGPDWSPSLYFETGSGRGLDTWKGPIQTGPQIDSMLNQQITPLQPRPQYSTYGVPFCVALEPSIHSLGPTASNDQGPYGPYWHDGTYIPYQPAALRDPRYYPHPATGPNWISQHHGGWQTYNTFPMNSIQQGSFPLHQSPHIYNHSGKPSLEYPISYPPTHHRSPPVDFQSQISAYPMTQRPHPDVSLSSSGQTTPVAATRPVKSALAEFGPQSHNAELRERVFAWAHNVYIDHLKFLQSTRKPSSTSRNPNGQHPSRPHIYPKPPRQPGVPFANVPSTVSYYFPQPPTSYPIVSSHPPGQHDIQGTTQPLREPGYPNQDQAYHRVSATYTPGGVHLGDTAHRQPWQPAPPQQLGNPNIQGVEPLRPLRRMSGASVAGVNQSFRHDTPSMTVAAALEAITKHCGESKWNWIDGILLGGCLAYALGDYQKAQDWYKHILTLDKNHVEAISNLAATYLALQQKREAEKHWRRAVKLRPSYFDAVEHLIGLLCGDSRGQEAVQIIEFVEHSLKYVRRTESFRVTDLQSERSNSSVSQSPNLSEASDQPVFDYDGDYESGLKDLDDLPGSDQPGFGSSGYAIPGSENNRILALVHAKGNMLYALGDNVGAARAFENAVLIGCGQEIQGISGLIKRILSVVGYDAAERSPGGRRVPPSNDPVLLHPDAATKTAQLCFPPSGELPGLRHVPSEGLARKAAISTTSNSLLSLAKIFQDGMATNSPKPWAYQTTHGVREILALYYLSLSLQPSPSTANNVGILLASVQQAAPSKYSQDIRQTKNMIPGLVPGSGIALALAYYNYGLVLDSRHAHLYTNLGSLLKDIGQLDVAIQMYEQAVNCDGNFDIALANLANAVKDKGRISDAITYYKRAVKASPDFAEAVCGLANALNSVCGWAGRGGIADDGGSRDRWHVNERGMLLDATVPGATSSGWIKRVVDLVEKQLGDGEDWGRGIMDEGFVKDIVRTLALLDGSAQEINDKQKAFRDTLTNWRGQKWEGARLVRLVERATRRLSWHWYQDRRMNRQRQRQDYRRPQLPSALTVPAAPTVLPFHTFTCPMSAKQIRLISQRNGLRISCSTLKAPWLPPNVYAPPPTPRPHLNVGYVSSDFNNHPLAHLMQSVFGLHDPKRVKSFCYATTASDGSIHRQQIEREAPIFYDASSWSAERLVNRIVGDEIHILINLNGYTRGARNEVFAARPAPIQMSFMGFAGTLGAEWCDYLLADETAVPRDTLREYRSNVQLEDQLIDNNSGGKDDKWIYGENIIFCRDTFFCCDHRQSAPDSQGRQFNWEEEQERRWSMRKEIFPQLPDDAIILGNFNQLYKIEPTTFRTWLRILQRLPKAVLWLLRFPDLGETNLKQTALMWAGPEVASRVLFTDVAQKHQHIARARVCDLFLDTPECNAHTTAADVLWSGTPLLTLPRYKYKMCSRMAASILKGALPKNEEGKRAAKELIAGGEEEYEEMAVRLGLDCVYNKHRATGRLSELRKLLYEARWSSALFDTKRWVRDLEDAYDIAWKRWEDGVGGDIWLEPQRDF